MKWKGRRASTNVKDYRGRRSGGAGGANLVGLLFQFGSRLGIKGIIGAVIIGGVLWKMGLVDPMQLLGGAAQESSGPIQASAQEQEQMEFVKVILADNEDIWKAEFARHGARFEDPQLIVFRNSVRTGCGAASAASGPFYCPADRSIYIDLGFYDQLERSFDAPGDFAQAYVIAHEVGHHIQTLVGTSQEVSAMRGKANYNEYSVRLELQADFYAGVWTNHSQQYLERGDIEEALRAANAIGDDAIQLKAQGKVVPHTFTHGTSEQRMRWFNKGLRSGRIEDGDTFSMPYSEL